MKHTNSEPVAGAGKNLSSSALENLRFTSAAAHARRRARRYFALASSLFFGIAHLAAFLVLLRVTQAPANPAVTLYMAGRFAAGCYWGCLVGYVLFEAVREAKVKGSHKAREWLVPWGAALSILQSVLVLAFAQMGGNLSLQHLDSASMRWLLGYLASNLCLQATFLMWIVGLFMPKHPHNEVQITEDLRL